MVIPRLVYLITTDAGFRSQFLADLPAALAAQQITPSDEEWAALLEVRRILMQADRGAQPIDLPDGDRWVGGIAFSHAALFSPGGML